MFKSINLFLAFMFTVCAGLQWNDPDPYLWIPLYLLSVLGCLLAAKGVYKPKFYIGVIAIYLVYAAYLFLTTDGVLSWMVDHSYASLTESMKATEPWIENTREFGGLFIMLVALTWNFFVLKSKSTPDPEPID